MKIEVNLTNLYFDPTIPCNICDDKKHLVEMFVFDDSHWFSKCEINPEFQDCSADLNIELAVRTEQPFLIISSMKFWFGVER